MAAPQLRGDRRDGGTVPGEVERVEHYVKGGQVGPCIGDTVSLQVAVENQPCENVGDLVGQHRRRVQILA